MPITISHPKASPSPLYIIGTQYEFAGNSLVAWWLGFRTFAVWKVKTQVAWVQFLVGELRSHKPHGTAKKKTKKNQQQRSLLKKWMYTFNPAISVWKFILLLADENYSRNLDHSGTGLYSPPVLHFHLWVGPWEPHSPESSLFSLWPPGLGFVCYCSWNVLQQVLFPWSSSQSSEWNLSMTSKALLLICHMSLG